MRRTRNPGGLFPLFFRLAVVLISIGITTEFFGPFPKVGAIYMSRVEETQLGSTKPTKVQVCGSHLASVIKLKCRDQRHRTTGLHNPAVGPIRFHRPNGIAKESRQSALHGHGGLIDHTDRFKRLPLGVVQECCMQACYESQLLKYCGFGPDFGRAEEIIATTPTPSTEESQPNASENDIETAFRETSKSDTENSVLQEVADVVPLILEILWDLKGFNTPTHPTATRYHKQNGNHRDYPSPSSHPGARHMRHLNHHLNETIIASALTSTGHGTGFRPSEASSAPRSINSDETQRDLIHSYEEPTSVPDFSYNGGAPNQFPFAIPTGTSRDEYDLDF